MLLCSSDGGEREGKEMRTCHLFVELLFRGGADRNGLDTMELNRKKHTW